MSSSIKLSSVAINCPDAPAPPAFYADITGGRITFSDRVWATVDGPGGRIDFQTVPRPDSATHGCDVAETTTTHPCVTSVGLDPAAVQVVIDGGADS